MALTPAEKQRRYRERLKDKRDTKKERRLAGPDLVDAISKEPFSEYLPLEEWHEVVTYLEWAGIAPAGIPSFDADDDPGHDPRLDADEPNRGSIGRAERMVGCLLDAAGELAGIIYRYKREQIDGAIADLEAGDLADPASRKQVMAEIVRLTKIGDQLAKQRRHQLPEWKVKGE